MKRGYSYEKLFKSRQLSYDKEMGMKLKNKVVIITGASGGIGKVTARLFARHECILILVGRHADKLHELANELKAEYRIQTLVCPMDIGNYDMTERMAGAVIEQFGRIDILINNAGIGLFKSLDETTESEIRRVIDTNLLGAMFCTQAVLPFMKQQNFGHIINIASVAGRRAFAQLTAYCASKYGLIGFSDALRCEMLKAGIPIHVTVINPPAVDTEFFHHAGYETYQEDHPLVHLLCPQTVADRILRAVQSPGAWEVVITPRARILNFLNKLSPRLIEFLNRKAAKAVNKK